MVCIINSLGPGDGIWQQISGSKLTHRSKFVIMPHCEILLYKRQLVVLTYELIYVVRLLTARGKIIVEKGNVASSNQSPDLSGNLCDLILTMLSFFLADMLLQILSSANTTRCQKCRPSLIVSGNGLVPIT